MAFAYDPKDAGNKLIPDGEYEAVIAEAEETMSKKGSPMLKLQVKVWAKGDTYHIPDYIVSPSGLWKLRQLTGALGMSEAFARGSIEARELVNKNVLVFIKTRKDETGKYQDQNVVTKYSSPANDTTAPAPSDGDDDMPF